MDARDPHTVVVGGGLAGLTAAACLARAGRRVTLLEAGDRLGGRAHTRRRDGFELNLGPHAVYRAGGGRAVLRSLGVHVDGRMPKLHRAGFLAGGEVVAGLAHVRRTGRPLEVLRAMAGLGPRSLGPWEGRPATELVDALVTEDAGRDVIRSVLRTATYSGDLARLDAGAAAHQLRTAMHGVLYLHHGWSSLVEQLADVIGRAGGRIRTRAAVEAVEHDTRVRSVRLADGTTVGADAVVVAVHDARRVPALLDGPGREAVAAAVEATTPVRMAHLDLALRPLPQERFPSVLGIDEPIYLTVQSDVADVAPPGGAVIHVGRYLRPDEEDGDHRDAIEHVLDVAQPGWRDHVVDARYVPRSMVSNDHARPATRGPLERPHVDVAGVAGLAVAGDWIGPAGTLADASILSGRAAATAITTMMDAAMHPTAVPA